MVNEQAYNDIISFAKDKHATLVAVSKLKPASDIEKMYALGQRDFGENYVQELVEKQAQLPADINWHFIGHLQSNKVKYIAPFVHLIHSVDSEKLLKEIDKQAAKNNRTINVLLQVHIAEEETKFGFDEAELMALDISLFKNVHITGLMGMATLNFAAQKNIALSTLSMGMSDDYALAINCGSNMVRIGSLLFGRR
jgi:PLP dependent protein